MPCKTRLGTHIRARMLNRIAAMLAQDKERRVENKSTNFSLDIFPGGFLCSRSLPLKFVTRGGCEFRGSMTVNLLRRGYHAT
jgi:hypothetical protein